VAAFEPDAGWVGVIAGAIVGWLLARQRRLGRRLAAIEARLQQVAAVPVEVEAERKPPPEAPAPQTPSWAAAPPPETPAPQTPSWAAAPPPETPTTQAPSGIAPPPEEPAPLPARLVAPPAAAAQAPAFASFAWVKRWFTEGNVPVKVGMIVLFAGVAALLKYATDEGWLRVPIELRLAAVAAAAICSLFFGWRERERRRTFALSLQGGSIGILVLTIFAALRLYDLLPAGLAFALLVAITAGTGALAVLQDARALAVLAILAGFLAPILVSTGSGNHVALFTWYALLDLAIFAIAWKKAWRLLNVVGFTCTFGVATAWGVLRYEPALFASTEPFLAFFFAVYVAIPVLYGARRHTSRGEALVDGTLVFGTPVVALGLQAMLLRGDLIAIALSALAIAAVELAVARLVWRRAEMRVMGEAFAALAIAFATLAVPLALSARTSAGVFAVEGAALIWLGLRQDRRLARWSGFCLELLAALVFQGALFVGGAARVPVANGIFAGALLLVAGAGLGALAWWRMRREALPASVLFLLSLAWWAFAGVEEIDRFVPPHHQPDALLAFAALSALLLAAIHRRVEAPLPAWSAALAYAAALPLLFFQLTEHGQPFAGLGAGAWLAFGLLGFAALHLLRDAPRAPLALAHLCWLHAWALAFAFSLLHVAQEAELGSGWRHALFAVPLLAVLAALVHLPRAVAPPLGDRFDAYRGWIAATFAAAVTCVFLVALFLPGDAAPLPFLPLANPIDLASAAALLLVANALRPHRLHAPAVVGGGLLLATAATLRAVHHLADLPWNAALVGEATAQTSLSVVWSALGVVAWVAGSRRGSRPLWLAGAALMALVLGKLAIVDRTHLGNIAGIVSFLAYGVLCTVVGYLAPAPPRTQAPAPPPTPTP